MKKIIFLFFVILVCCDPTDLKLIIVNKTDKVFYFQIRPDDEIYKNAKDFDYSKIKALDSMKPHFARGRSGASEYFINNKCKDSAIHIHIFLVDTLKYYGWEKSILNHKYTTLKYKVKDLDQMNWRVVYDGK